jgi:alkaline phosphatase
MLGKTPFKRNSILVFTLLFSLSSETATSATEKPPMQNQTSDDWRQAGRAAAVRAAQAKPDNRPAKNVILMVGDGMGLSTITAARILEGQLRGEPGEENLLFFETFPYTALIKTYNSNQQTPDSAGTMTALMTGVKTKAGVLSLGPEVARGATENIDAHRLETLLERAEHTGRATGIVTTTRLTHATPAACYAHSSERKWESDADLSPAARTADFPDIARQLIEFPLRAKSDGRQSDGIEVALGGGRHAFLPRSPVGWVGDQPGQRRDGRDLTREWLQQKQSAYVSTRAELEALDLAQVQHLLGLFNASNLNYSHERSDLSPQEPSLPEMTRVALEILQKNESGFFLMVEGGRIDHAHHSGTAHAALLETLEFAEAVRVAVENSDPEETLILVTADHSSSINLGGYSTRGNPVLGMVRENDTHGNAEDRLARDRNDQPYTGLTYGYGAGSPVKMSAYETISSGTESNTILGPEDLQVAAVPLKTGAHAGEDVPLYATGPGSHMFHGVLEQNTVFHLMLEALQLNSSLQRPATNQ